MTGNERLSDYLSKYDQEKAEQNRAAAEKEAAGVALAKEIVSRIDVSLGFSRAIANSWVYHNARGAEIVVAAHPGGFATIKGPDDKLPVQVQTVAKALTELARIIRES